MPAYGSNTLRLFVAAYPPPGVVAGWLQTLAALDLPPHRTTPPEQVHLTLHFIGDTDRRQLDQVRESVERSCAGLGAFALSADRLISLPQRGPARLVAVSAPIHPTASELHERLARRLARPGKRKESCLPHWTLARFQTPTQCGLNTPIDPVEIRVVRVVLVRSVLGVAGAAHTPIEEFSLG